MSFGFGAALIGGVFGSDRWANGGRGGGRRPQPQLITVYFPTAHVTIEGTVHVGHLSQGWLCYTPENNRLTLEKQIFLKLRNIC